MVDILKESDSVMVDRRFERAYPSLLQIKAPHPFVLLLDAPHR